MPGKSTQILSRCFPVTQRDRDWGLFVTSLCELSVAPGAVYPPSEHPEHSSFCVSEGRRLREYQLLYISAGRGWFKAEERKRVPVCAGTVILMFPRMWHSYAPEEDSGWDEHWVRFDGAWARRVHKQGFFDSGNPVMRVRSEGKLLGLFRDMEELARGNKAGLTHSLAATTAQMLALLYSARQMEMVSEDSREQRVVQQVVMALRQSLDRPVSVSNLAMDFKVSYRWLRRAFSRHTGFSPHHYLLELRLARARDLLAQTTLSIKEVALQVGFEDAQYFCRVFHAKVGRPPGIWRESARMSSN